MNVLIVNPYAIPPTCPGGTRHFSFARALSSRGHSVLLVAGSFDHATRTQRNSHRETRRLENVDGVPFLWLRTPEYGSGYAMRLLNMLVFAVRVARLRRSLEPFDVVVGSSPHPFGAVAALVLARQWRAPFVLEVRDLWPESLQEILHISSRHPFVVLVRWSVRLLYRRSRAVIALLPGASRALGQYGVSRDKVVWVPNGIDLDLVPPLEAPGPHARFLVMYAGAHGPPNALDQILGAAQILPSDQFHFVLVGEGSDKAKLIREAEARGIANIEFLPPVPKTEIYELLASADALVVTMQPAADLYRYGLSFNKLFDYLAVGRPVAMASASEYDLIGEAGAGITVPAGDIEALAGAIRSIAGLGDGEREEWGRRGRDYVERHYDVNALAGRFEEVLASVVESGV